MRFVRISYRFTPRSALCILIWCRFGSAYVTCEPISSNTQASCTRIRRRRTPTTRLDYWHAYRLWINGHVQCAYVLSHYHYVLCVRAHSIHELERSYTHVFAYMRRCHDVLFWYAAPSVVEAHANNPRHCGTMYVRQQQHQHVSTLTALTYTHPLYKAVLRKHKLLPLVY